MVSVRIVFVLAAAWAAVAVAQETDDRLVIEGRVLGLAEGSPVPGAVVRARFLAGEEDAETDLGATTANADGRFGLSLAPPAAEGLLLLQAEAAGHAPVAVRCFVVAGETGAHEVDLALAPGVSARCRVVAPDGSPAAGARVRLRRRLSDADKEREDPRLDEARLESDADAAGELGWAGVAPGTHRIEAWTANARAEAEARIVGGEVVEIRLQPSPGGRKPRPRCTPPDWRQGLTGRVLASGTGEPIAGAEVSACGRTVRSDSTGRFKIDGLPADSVVVTVSALGHNDVRVQRREDTWLFAGEEREQDLELDLAPPRIIARVVTANGAPVAGTEVIDVRATGLAKGCRSERPLDRRLQPTRLDGTLALVLQPSDPDFEHPVCFLVAAHSLLGRGSSESILPSRASPDAVLEVRLAAAVHLRGRLVDAEGRPVAGALLAAVEWRGRFEDEWSLDYLAPVTGTSDRDGGFFLANVPHGPVEVRVRADGFLEGTYRYLWVDPGVTPAPMELRLLRSP